MKELTSQRVRSVATLDTLLRLVINEVKAAGKTVPQICILKPHSSIYIRTFRRIQANALGQAQEPSFLP
jgi:hypothetical protein